MARQETIGVLINRVLPACGLNKVADPFTSVDQAVQQMVSLATDCGRELVKMYDWAILQQEHVITTQSGDTGKYDLPDGLDRIMNVTGWSRTQRVKLPGSVNAQTWQYLKGRNLVSSTIYAVYREVQNQFWVYPQPPDAAVPVGLDLAFEYISERFAIDADSVGNPTYPDNFKCDFTKSGDLCLFSPILFQQLLKLRFKEAKGQDTTAAQQEWALMFSQIAAQDVSADNLNAANMSQPFPYLDMWRNTPDSGFGTP